MTTVPSFYQGQDFYVPYFEVRLGKKPLKEDVVRDVIQVSYKDNIKEIDSFDITINNWDAEKRTYKYTEQNLFDPGKELQLWMGYYGKDRLRKMISGEITGLRPNFPPSGQPTLAISGLNVLHRLRDQQKTSAYEKKSYSDIAREIGRRFNVTVKVDQGDQEKYNHLFQKNEYDLVFLMNRAREIGYELFIIEKGEETILYFGPSTNAEKVPFKFVYGQSLIQFQPNLSTANQVNEVTVIGWDKTKKTKIKSTAKRSQIITQGHVRFEKSFKDRKEVITDKPIESEAEARRLAIQTLEDIAKEMITATGSTVGLPELRAGNKVEIKGLGDLFSGPYFVTATTHTIDSSGYITQFECRKEQV